MQAFCPGIYPRSEALVQATRDLDRGRTTAEAVEEQVERDLEELVALQQAAGLDVLADGMLRWQDLLRPLLEASEGLEPGPLTRFLDTNTFYRAPRVTGPVPRLRAPLDESYIAPIPSPRLVTLPSPYALARGTGLPPRVLAETILRPQIAALEADLVVLTEPFLARDGEAELGALAEALAVLSGGPPLALHLTFADAAPFLPHLAELPVEGIGIDFYKTQLEAVPKGFPKLILAGVVDARSSLLEDEDELAEFAVRLRERVAGEIALVPNGDLQLVSEPIAREKVARLGGARAAVKEAPA